MKTELRTTASLPNADVLPLSIPSDPEISSGWQHILWREWRHCDDAPYAERLFEMLAGTGIDRRAIVTLAALTGLTGIVIGWLGAWLLFPAAGPLRAVGAGVLSGLLIGGLTGASLSLKHHITWLTWLRSLIPGGSFAVRLKKSTLRNPGFVLAAGLGSGLGVGITGAIFFERFDFQFLVFMWIAWLAWAVVFILQERQAIIGLVIGLLMGVPFGLFSGLGIAQLVGLAVGPVDIYYSAVIVGGAVGVLTGLFIGRQFGLLGLVIWQVAVLLLIVLTGNQQVLYNWFWGITTGGVIGSLSQLWLPSEDQLGPADLYPFLRWLFWWRGRPPCPTSKRRFTLKSTITVG